METYTATVLVNAGAELGEGPVWDEANQRLLWVDILAGHIHASTPDGDDQIIWEADSPVGCIAARADGSWIVAERDRLTAVWDWSRREELIVLPIDADVRTNDGKLDPAGRMIVGTMQMDAEPGRGQLFSWDGAGLRTLVEPVTISNGLGWTADSRTMYYIDTPTQQVAAYDYDLATGDISNRRVLAEIDPADGHPDGMCVGPDGGLWVALWGGYAVRRFRPDGTHVGDVRVDAHSVSCCVFGDDGVLYITTARQDSPDGPGDGGVHRVLR
jgi:sugar lactone lactonase YvrE